MIETTSAETLKGRAFDSQFKTAEIASKDKRRMVLLRRMGLFTSPDTQGFVIKRAFDLNELKKAYSVVHDIFVEQGFILPCLSGMRIRPFEISKHIATFIGSS